MSLRIMIYCDECGFPDDATTTPAMVHWDYADMAGWECTDDHDLCPTCSAGSQ